MIIIKISDGFGNQLFMYACGYAAAKQLNTKLILDTSYLDTSKLRNYELDKLNICYYKQFSTAWIKPHFLKILYRKLVHLFMRLRYPILYYQPEFSQVKNNCYLHGNYVTERFFKKYRSDLLQLFTPKYGLSEGCKRYIQQVKSCNSVAVHIRRGDYVKMGNCLDYTYYQKAFEYIGKYVKNTLFFVFSDDLEYAQQMFNRNEQKNIEYIKYVSDNTTIDDFFIMKSCKHIIMANSSFSWWAAWLNENCEKMILYPELKTEKHDIYPKEWIPIPTTKEPLLQ